ncbi:hypothetical protein ACA910_001557 [Epithemia clementina (nom. ined.)]
MVVSIDGVNMKTWEQKHPTLPVNKKNYSQKYNHGAVKYEIAINVWTGKIVWNHGPYRGGAHDITIFKHGLKDKLADGKMAIADRGYATSDPVLMRKLATPNPADSNELQRFKSRVPARHETLNERIKTLKFFWTRTVTMSISTRLLSRQFALWFNINCWRTTF